MNKREKWLRHIASVVRIRMRINDDKDGYALYDWQYEEMKKLNTAERQYVFDVAYGKELWKVVAESANTMARWDNGKVAAK